MIFKKLLIVSYLIFKVFLLTAQTNIYPTNWWIGMQWNTVQLLVYNNKTSIKNGIITIQYPGVAIKKIHVLDNDKYLAIDITIAPHTQPGKVKITLKNNNSTETIIWPLLQKRLGNGTIYAQGVRSQDFIYLLMPDRFSNGNTANDKIVGFADQSLNRSNMYERHGGDIQGIINKIDYLKDLGVTTLWTTPVLENNMPTRTEHGYAITNHYKIDARLGTNEEYKNLANTLHKNGMKLIQDAVYNHIGLNHFTVIDLPTKDWLHHWPTYTQTTYKDQTVFDPYAAQWQTKIMVDGWFAPTMPDVNQTNPYAANYLIQHALWCVQEFGVDGFRIDTYAYNNGNFMNACNKALLAEYPSLTMFGETWVHGVVNQSYFCENNLQIPFKSNLQNTTDFQTLLYGIQPALTEPQGWIEGVTQLYNTAAQDILYKNPMGQVIFLDNHDLSRFYSVLDKNLAKYKMALAWLLTYRGIPQLYYGSEILMTGYTNPDGLVRSDFLGGWQQDETNKFLEVGRTNTENEIFYYIKKLAKFRLQSNALKLGKMIHYTPEAGLYVYARIYKGETIVCLMNTSNNTKQIDVSNYKEISTGYTQIKNVITGVEGNLKTTLLANELQVLFLKK